MRHFTKTLFLIIIGCLISCKNKLDTPDNFPQSLQITAETYSIYSGGSFQLSAIATYDDGSTDDVTNEAVWSTGSGQVGHVTENGLFVAFDEVVGMETVRADFHGVSDSVEIEVTVAARFLAIWPVSVSAEPGQTVQFEAVVEFQNDSNAWNTGEIDWSISPGQYGMIDDAGLFTANS